MNRKLGESFDAFLTDCPAGATVGVRITSLTRNEIIVPRSTTVTEYVGATVGNPTPYSIFKAALTAPTTGGSFLIVWDVNGDNRAEDLTVETERARS